RPHFDSGALGFAGDGTVVVRDASRLAIKDRVAVNAAVADDNRDRKAVYREIAVANGHPEWEPQIRDVFARQWIASARPGWWYQQGGTWERKEAGRRGANPGAARRHLRQCAAFPHAADDTWPGSTRRPSNSRSTT